MISYMDRTWCSQSLQCANTGCDRYITDEMVAEAQRLGLPIAYGDFRLYAAKTGEDCGWEAIDDGC